MDELTGERESKEGRESRREGVRGGEIGMRNIAVSGGR